MFRNDTRDKIMSRIASGMHESGYQGLRTDRVIEQLGITKGAFYHYFIDKPSAALAVIDEIHARNYVGAWQGLQNDNVIGAIIGTLSFIKTTITDENVHLGCPVNNLIQEMSPLDEVFRGKLEAIVSEEVRLLTEAFAYGVAHGQIQPDIDARDEAFCIINSMHGAYSTSKLFRSKPIFDGAVDRIIRHLQAMAL
jgi:AcrR family transcriptional regulator